MREKPAFDENINRIDQLPSVNFSRELRTGQQVERLPEMNIVKRNVTPQLSVRKHSDGTKRASIQR